MKRLASASFVFLVLTAYAQAQSPAKQAPSVPPAKPRPAPVTLPARPAPSPGISISAGELTATPEMWFYEQALRQYNDPKWVIRQKAEFRAAERARRIEAMKWYGFSNSRPMAGVDPIQGDYGPHWSSGNIYFPFRWSAAGAPTVVVATSKSTRQ